MVSQIGVVVTETASHEGRPIIEKHVIQASDTGDYKRSRIKKDFTSRNGGLLAAVGCVGREIHPWHKGRKNVLIEWRRGIERIVDANGKRLTGDGGGSARRAISLQRSRYRIDRLSH